MHLLWRQVILQVEKEERKKENEWGNILFLFSFFFF